MWDVDPKREKYISYSLRLIIREFLNIQFKYPLSKLPLIV